MVQINHMHACISTTLSKTFEKQLANELSLCQHSSQYKEGGSFLYYELLLLLSGIGNYNMSGVTGQLLITAAKINL